LSGAQTGYVPVAYFIPLFLTIKYLKYIPILNVQMLMYGLNSALGFVFTVLFIRKIGIKSQAASVLGGLLYVCSPLLFKTLYNHQLPAMYLVSIMPGCLWLFTKSVLDKKNGHIMIATIIFSLFSTTLNTLPWWSAFVLTSIPFLIRLLVCSPKRFILTSFVFVVVGVILNSYWIVPYIDSLHSNRSNSLVNNYTGADYRIENLRIANGVVGLYSPYEVLRQLGLLLFPIVFIVLTRKNNFGLLLASSIILAWYFYSPNFGEGGRNAFLYLIEHVPFWGMYRNMFDKFALGLAFWFAVGVGYAVDKSKILGILAVISLFIGVGAGVPMLKANPESKNVFSGEFNSDFTDLVNYLKYLPNSKRIIWFPLNFPAYASIKDTKGNWYFGPSPVLELAWKNDITGQFSFLVPGEIEWGRRIYDDLSQGKYDSYTQAVSYLDIGYAILNKDIPEGNIADFFYGGTKRPLLQFKPLYLGKLMAKFGNRYELYEFTPPPLPKNIVSLPYSSRWQANFAIKPVSPIGMEIDGSISKANLQFKLPKVVKLFTWWSR
jgi:hypothetical protein